MQFNLIHGDSQGFCKKCNGHHCVQAPQFLWWTLWWLPWLLWVVLHKNERAEWGAKCSTFLFVCLFLLFLFCFLFVLKLIVLLEFFFFILFLLFLFKFLFVGRCYKGNGQIWRDWEMSGFEVCDEILNESIKINFKKMRVQMSLWPYWYRFFYLCIQ